MEPSVATVGGTLSPAGLSGCSAGAGISYVRHSNESFTSKSLRRGIANVSFCVFYRAHNPTVVRALFCTSAIKWEAGGWTHDGARRFNCSSCVQTGSCHHCRKAHSKPRRPGH
jgi:hypothetical protein